LKATALAHPIQGLIKYHGLKNPKTRIPYHDSISVCIQALSTATTVQTIQDQTTNRIHINGRKATPTERIRIETVLNKLSKTTGFTGKFKLVSENSLKTGKGLGFSASAFAALGLATAKALEISLAEDRLSEIIRQGAGSSTRSLSGGFSIWYADKAGRSYAEQMHYPENIDFSMVIVPIHSTVRTDEAHAEVLSSPLFQARLNNISKLLSKMKKAISNGDSSEISRLAEEDTLNLHAITMTGKSHMVLWEPDTLRVMKEVIRLREEGTPAWYSLDTGPSVFINTYEKNAAQISGRISDLGFKNVIESRVGGKPFLTSNHLF
jgi:phosphomevalonate decarboxylase